MKANRVCAKTLEAQGKNTSGEALLRLEKEGKYTGRTAPVRKPQALVPSGSHHQYWRLQTQVDLESFTSQVGPALAKFQDIHMMLTNHTDQTQRQRDRAPDPSMDVAETRCMFYEGQKFLEDSQTCEVFWRSKDMSPDQAPLMILEMMKLLKQHMGPRYADTPTKELFTVVVIEQLLCDERCKCHGERSFRGPQSKADAKGRGKQARKAKKARKKQLKKNARKH